MLKIKAIRPELLTLLASGFFLLAFNQALWQHLLQITSADSSGWLLRGAFVLLILAIFNLVLTLLAFRWVLKPTLTALLLFNEHYINILSLAVCALTIFSGVQYFWELRDLFREDFGK